MEIKQIFEIWHILQILHLNITACGDDRIMVVSQAANTINLVVSEILADQGKDNNNNNNNKKDCSDKDKKFTLLDDAGGHCSMKKGDC